MSKRTILSVLVAGFVAVNMAGCGDSILSAGLKLTNGQWSQLTPGEILLLNQAATNWGKSQTPPVNIGSLTADQAAAIDAFLKANNLNNQMDVENLVTSVQNGGTVKGLTQLAAAFPGIDPNTIDEQQLQNVLNQVFSGK